VNPFKKLNTVFAPRHAAAMNGAFGAIVRKAPNVSAFAPRRLLFIRWRPGRMRGRDVILPASLRKATMEPVKVTPPTME
jgi:hypothetical protein